MKDEVRKKCGVDLKDEISSWSLQKTNVETVEKVFVHKLFGFKDVSDYHYQSSCVHNIPQIKTPSLFINSLDDPIIGNACIDFDVFTQNPNVAIATTKHGGHLGYSESLCSQDFWVIEPILRFFTAIKEDRKN